MPPRLEIRRARGRVVEIHVAVAAAHQRAGIGDVRKPERMAQLMGEHLVEHDVAADLAARLGRRHLDANRQPNDAAITLELGDSHQSRAIGAAHTDQHLRIGGARGARAPAHAEPLARDGIPVVPRARRCRVQRGIAERREIHAQRQPRAGVTLGTGQRRIRGDRELTRPGKRRDGKDRDRQRPRRERAPQPSTLTVIATHAMIVSPTGTRSPPSTARTVTSPCGSSRLTASTSTAFGFGTPTVTSTSIRPPRARTSAKNGRLEWRIASETARRAAVVASAPCTSTPIPNSSTYGLAMPVSYDG